MVSLYRFPLYLKEAEKLFFEFFNVHNIRDVRQTEIYTAEPLVPDANHLEVEITIAKLKI
jgi:hypothetical protein